MILKMENVGKEKRTAMFYGVEDANDSYCLRLLLTDILDCKKNLENEILDTFKYRDTGNVYAYIGENEYGYLEYKKL